MPPLTPQIKKLDVQRVEHSLKKPQQKPARSSLVSRNITIDGHRTSIRLEPEMWEGIQDICKREHTSMHEICSNVAARKADNSSLTAAIRVFVMAYFRSATTEDGHTRAGHGPGGSYMTSLKQKPDHVLNAAKQLAQKSSYALTPSSFNDNFQHEHY